MGQVIWISACPNLAVKKRIAAHTETILGRVSRCGGQLESFTLTHYGGTSALDDGFEAVGFEVVARNRGGLRVCVRADLDAIILVRAGSDDVSRKSFLLQSLREGQCVTFALNCRDLEHDGSLGN